MNYYGSVSDRMKRLPKSYIQKIKTNGTFGTHFRLIDYKGDVIFDPYSPPVNVVSVFYSIVYAYQE